MEHPSRADVEAHMQRQRERTHESLRDAFSYSVLTACMFFLLVFLVLACTDCTGPRGSGQVFGAQQITPPTEYAQWWHELEQCSGLRRDMGAITFYAVDSMDRHAIGREDNGHIYIVSLFLGNKLVVSHEIMHALSRSTHNQHPTEYFNGRCGDLRGQ